MILFELTNSEDNSVYQDLEIANGNRHYDFLRSLVVTSLAIGRPFLSQNVVKALNYHAIACLHTSPGEYRPCPVVVGDHSPPDYYRVPALMDDFVNSVNRFWDNTDPVFLSTFVLWRLNYIHPFINGNGRTARAACYFVLCVKSGGWLPGSPILPELIRQNRDEYVQALRKADELGEDGQPNLTHLHELVSRLLSDQLESADDSETPTIDP